MAMEIWPEGSDDAINLGDPIRAWKAFADVAKVLEGKDDVDDYPEFQSTPGFGEMEVTKEWLDSARAQAKTFLERHGKSIQPATEQVIEWLINNNRLS